MLNHYYNDILGVSKYQHIFANNTIVPVDFGSNENILVFGHLIDNNNAVDQWFCYMCCAGGLSNSTARVFKIAGNYDMNLYFTSGHHLDINVVSSIWTQLSILYL
jgi:hypothetical protein